MQGPPVRAPPRRVWFSCVLCATLMFCCNHPCSHVTSMSNCGLKKKRVFFICSKKKTYDETYNLNFIETFKEQNQTFALPNSPLLCVHTSLIVIILEEHIVSIRYLAEYSKKCFNAAPKQIVIL